MGQQERKRKNALNAEYREFRTTLLPNKTKDALWAMQYIGCKSRPIFVDMAIEAYVRDLKISAGYDSSEKK